MREKLQGYKSERFRTYPNTGDKYLDRLNPRGLPRIILFIGIENFLLLSDLEKRNGYR